MALLLVLKSYKVYNCLSIILSVKGFLEVATALN